MIDLYYYHRPDGVTPLAETLSALQENAAAGAWVLDPDGLAALAEIG